MCAVIARTTTAAHYKRHKAQEISKSLVSTKGIEISVPPMSASKADGKSPGWDGFDCHYRSLAVLVS